MLQKAKMGFRNRSCLLMKAYWNKWAEIQVWTSEYPICHCWLKDKRGVPQACTEFNWRHVTFHSINMNQNEFTMVQGTVSWGFFFPALGQLLQDCFIPCVADAQDNTFMSSIFVSDSSWPIYHFGIEVLLGIWKPHVSYITVLLLPPRQECIHRNSEGCLDFFIYPWKKQWGFFLFPGVHVLVWFCVCFLALVVLQILVSLWIIHEGLCACFPFHRSCASPRGGSVVV